MSERRAFFRDVAAAAMGVKQAADDALADPARPPVPAQLAKASVLVVGAGAVGSPVAHYLAGAGVGRLGIVDPADVQHADLAAQPLHFTPDVGVAKAHSAVAKLGFLNPEIRIEPYQARFAPEMLAGQDLVVDTAGVVDTAHVPLMAAGASGERGWVALLPPGGCVECARGERGGAEGAVAGVVGSLAAHEALRALASPRAAGFRLDVDLAAASLTRGPLPRRAGCEHCAAVP